MGYRSEWIHSSEKLQRAEGLVSKNLVAALFFFKFVLLLWLQALEMA